ncbi:hypothetical protein DL89DRAFT_136059 [Linderina pennispora]|uniref:Secreted protein n=1 Tax=Linderina pennispora TaxID=61395 RepID=A0A1Y1WAI7_9FUNG|nr:uncharacterized protein DL89DRAFT_136059 [Linderina pennispora]ORX70557.1 hypothetical protein DL89DRAFT_136059 [Linderina pennispora]
MAGPTQPRSHADDEEGSWCLLLLLPCSWSACACAFRMTMKPGNQAWSGRRGLACCNQTWVMQEFELLDLWCLCDFLELATSWTWTSWTSWTCGAFWEARHQSRSRFRIRIRLRLRLHIHKRAAAAAEGLQHGSQRRPSHGGPFECWTVTSRSKLVEGLAE